MIVVGIVTVVRLPACVKVETSCGNVIVVGIVTVVRLPACVKTVVTVDP